MRDFLQKASPDDRVLVIGDTRQHQGVEAGKPFEQMQQAGMQTSQLDQIMRQKDAELLKAVQHLATGETEKGVELLAQQGRVTEVKNSVDRIAAIAKDYAAQPKNTIVVSPDNRSRQQIPMRPFAPSFKAPASSPRTVASSRHSRIVPTSPAQAAPGRRSTIPAM